MLGDSAYEELVEIRRRRERRQMKRALLFMTPVFLFIAKAIFFPSIDLVGTFLAQSVIRLVSSGCERRGKSDGVGLSVDLYDDPLAEDRIVHGGPHRDPFVGRLALRVA